MRTTRSRWSLGLTATLVLASAATACTNDSTSPVAQPSVADESTQPNSEQSATQLLRQLAISGDEVEGYPDLPTMRDASDGLVLVEITGLAGVREVSGGPPDDTVGYVQVQATVLEASDDRWTPNDELIIELLAPSNPDARDALLKGASSLLPAQQAVVFLRAKQGKGEEGLFRPVNSLGLWTSDNGSVTAPLYIDEVDSASRYVAEVGDPESVPALFSSLTDQ